MRHSSSALPLLVAALLAPSFARALDAKLPEGWQEVTRNNEVVVFFKENEKAQARDVLTYAEFDVSPEIAFKYASDFETYPKFMPYVKESKLHKKSSATDFITYQIMDIPLQPKRDMFLHVILTKGTKANGGVFKTAWTSEPDLEPETQGMVRMRINEGAWSFAPLDGGKRTRVTYTLLSHPGGGMPKWMVDQAVNSAPGVVKALRERITNELKAQSAAR